MKAVSIITPLVALILSNCAYYGTDKNGKPTGMLVGTRAGQLKHDENGFYAENMRNFKASLSTVARIERRRPRSGGEKTTLVVGYKLSYGAEFIEPCTA